MCCALRPRDPAAGEAALSADKMLRMSGPHTFLEGLEQSCSNREIQKPFEQGVGGSRCWAIGFYRARDLLRTQDVILLLCAVRLMPSWEHHLMPAPVSFCECLWLGAYMFGVSA